MAFATGSILAGADAISGGGLTGGARDLAEDTIRGIGGVIGIGGVDREGSRSGTIFLKEVADAIRSGADASGTVRVELEYYGDASKKSDSSRRGAIYTRVMRFPTAHDGSDSGRIHNEVSIRASDIVALSQYIQSQDDVKAYVLESESNLQMDAPTPDGTGDRRKPGAPSGPPSQEERQEENGGGQTMGSPAQAAGISPTVLILVVGAILYFVAQQ